MVLLTSRNPKQLRDANIMMDYRMFEETAKWYMLIITLWLLHDKNFDHL